MTSILIIEDDDTVRGLLRSVLEAEGYEVTEAANGRQGLNQYRLKRRTWSSPIFTCPR